MGKSAVANMIIGENIIPVPNPEIFQSSEILSYSKHESELYTFYEMLGMSGKRFNEDEMKEAMRNLKEIVTLLENGDGIHLIICVMSLERITDNFVKNYQLFVEQLMGKSVPVILVYFCVIFGLINNRCLGITHFLDFASVFFL